MLQINKFNHSDITKEINKVVVIFIEHLTLTVLTSNTLRKGKPWVLSSWVKGNLVQSFLGSEVLIFQ